MPTCWSRSASWRSPSGPWVSAASGAAWDLAWPAWDCWRSSRSCSSISPTGSTRGPRLRASRAPRRFSKTVSTRSSQPRADWFLPDCSTMRGRAEYEPTRQEGPQAPEEEDHDAGPQVGPGSQERRSRSAAPRRLHPRRHGHAEEAELGSAQDRPCAPDQRHGGHHLHPRRGTQSSGALGRADSRRSRQGPAGRPLQGHPRHPRRRRRLRPQAGPLPLRGQGFLVPRRSAATIRPVEPDARHRNRLVQQIINKVMSDGKKSLAERIVYDALAIVAERSGEDPVETLESAIKSLTPVLEVRSRRVGGATYQVPVEVPARRARTLAVRWLVQYARARREDPMAERLASEILDANQQQGSAWKRKDDIYRMAQANKAFAHYRW